MDNSLIERKNNETSYIWRWLWATVSKNDNRARLKCKASMQRPEFRWDCGSSLARSSRYWAAWTNAHRKVLYARSNLYPLIRIAESAIENRERYLKNRRPTVHENRSALAISSVFAQADHIGSACMLFSQSFTVGIFCITTASKVACNNLFYRVYPLDEFATCGRTYGIRLVWEHKFIHTAIANMIYRLPTINWIVNSN